MASDYGDEAGGKLLDWMLRIGQEAGAEAMARSARELSERLAGIRGTISGGRAEAIAAEVGIGHVLSEVRPDEKAAAIERLRAQGKTVCMVGDGINDTPALAVADCAVAMGGGSDIAIESAGILLPSGNLEKLPELFDISRATIRTIRQNLTWALFYNLVSIPVAALGVLHPSICATAMSASSIGVLMHSLRLKDSGKKERRFPWKKKS